MVGGCGGRLEDGGGGARGGGGVAFNYCFGVTAHELCERRSGRPGLPVPNRTVYVGVKQH